MQSLDTSFLFKFPFLLFSLFGSRVRVRVTSWTHCHTSVTLDDMVTVLVTSHEVTEKSIKDSGKIILYNIYYIYWASGKHMVI